MIDLIRSSIEEDGPLLAEIGRVVVLWSLVSRSLYRIVCRYGSTEERDSFYATGTDYNRIERASRMWRENETDHPRQEELLASLEQLKGLLKNRNLIVHGLPAVTYQKETSKKIAIIADPKISQMGGVPIAELLEIHTNEVRELASVLDDILTEPIVKMLDELERQMPGRHARPGPLE